MGKRPLSDLTVLNQGTAALRWLCVLPAAVLGTVFIFWQDRRDRLQRAGEVLGEDAAAADR